MARLPKAKKRVPFSATLRPESYKLLKELARYMDRSQGQTIDRAVQALAVAESFGGAHLNVPRATPRVEVVMDGVPQPVSVKRVAVGEYKVTRKPPLKPKERK